MTNLPPAGWYLDPENSGQQRYWDGSTWTEHRIAAADAQPYPAPEHTATIEPIEHTAQIPLEPTPETAPEFAPQIAPEPGRVPPVSADKPWYLRWWAVLGAVVVFVFVLLAVIGSLMGDSDTGAPALTPRPTVTVTAAAPTEPPSVPASVPPTTAAAEPTPTPAPSPTSQVGNPDDGAGNGSDSFVLPDETGKSLQAAQDDLQAVSGNPLFYSASDDATGQGRMQLIDSGWKVCSQTPAAGTRVTQDDDITFHTVRKSETCP